MWDEMAVARMGQMYGSQLGSFIFKSDGSQVRAYSWEEVENPLSKMQVPSISCPHSFSL